MSKDKNGKQVTAATFLKNAKPYKLQDFFAEAEAAKKPRIPRFRLFLHRLRRRPRRTKRPRKHRKPQQRSRKNGAGSF